MIRFCPNCQSERSLSEIFCEGSIQGQPCGWDLSAEAIHPAGWRPQPVLTQEAIAPPASEPPAASAPLCANGHPLQPGDLMCLECGAAPAEGPLPMQAEATPQPAVTETLIDGWRLLRQIASSDGVRERYLAEHAEGARQAVLTLYRPGAEPDPAIYDVIRRLPREHVPEILATGRWDERAYEVVEELTGGSLAELGTVLEDREAVRHVVRELGHALHVFNEAGLRHRDLRPASLLVRSHEPLDLVISGFGPARLSEFDLDIVSPLETSRYTGPRGDRRRRGGGFRLVEPGHDPAGAVDPRLLLRRSQRQRLPDPRAGQRRGAARRPRPAVAPAAARPACTRPPPALAVAAGTGLAGTARRWTRRPRRTAKGRRRRRQHRPRRTALPQADGLRPGRGPGRALGGGPRPPAARGDRHLGRAHRPVAQAARRPAPGGPARGAGGRLPADAGAQAAEPGNPADPARRDRHPRLAAGASAGGLPADQRLGARPARTVAYPKAGCRGSRPAPRTSASAPCTSTSNSPKNSCASTCCRPRGRVSPRSGRSASASCRTPSTPACWPWPSAG